MADPPELTPDSLDDLRIRGIRPLVPSACLIDDVAAEQAVYDSVKIARQSLSRALRGEDGRLIVVAGPVSAHDPDAVMEYARKLKELELRLRGELIIVMRVFLDEPAGGAGYWSGAMYDPDLDGSFQINKGFRQARQLLVDINRLGLPAGCLYLDTISPQFVADLVSWSCISSKTSQSFLHRELASGLSTPVGFQAIGDSPEGATLTLDAVRMSAAPHAFLSVSKQGVAGIVETTGNRDCHVVLASPDAEVLTKVATKLDVLELPARAMINCASEAETRVVASRVAANDKHVLGVLLPSFLVGGAQLLRPGDTGRTYGQSVTEPCMDWAATASSMEALAAAVKERRKQSAPTPDRQHSVHLSPAFREHGRLEATDNLRVRCIRPLMPAAVCIEELEPSNAVKHLVFQTRCEISGMIHGDSDRMLVVAGPAVVHDAKAAIEYAARLKALAEEVSDALLIVMQVNFEDSSSVPTGGWKGLINDPKLNGSYKINQGVREARELLLRINQLGLPAGCEYLDTITPQFIADLISWAMVGPRTCASRSHRELASGLSTPVGFHKGVAYEGHDARIATEAVRASSAPHAFLSVSKQGVAGIVETTGNSDCHVVVPSNDLGGAMDAERSALGTLKLPSRLMVHCASQGSTMKAQAEQVQRVTDVAKLVRDGDDGILGVILPSFLLSGRQDLHSDSPLSEISDVRGGGRAYGQSVTEPCMDWAATVSAIESLAEAVRARQSRSGLVKRPRVG